ncbi:hypothetical protein I3842_15G090000 [Carya illinoinensis]|uniref:Uncharacterized protein n=1 Tax=Carya illinoinensis TaxID=32201 RepID=A0A922AA88_CARIL|nr:hypothetical protein I3842_15G090000 [Carya illinoinensis]
MMHGLRMTITYSRSIHLPRAKLFWDVLANTPNNF